MRYRLWLLAVLTGLLATGCFGPAPPMFGDGESVPEEASRVPLPVRPGSDGTWVLNAPEAGMLGQGRTVVRQEGTEREGTRIPGWRLTLPAEFALTSHHPGAPHSVLLPGNESGYGAVLVGGRDGHRGPTAIAGLDPVRGRLTWRHALPPGGRVLLSGTVVVSCRPDACRLTGWDAVSGRQRWTRTVRGVTRVLDPCQDDGFADGPSPGRESCDIFLVSPDRVGDLGPVDGRLSWGKDPRPPDHVDRIVQDSDRIIMATSPAKGSCRATVVAGGVQSGAGDRGWRRTFVWDQPQARRDPRTGCRWDRTLPLIVGFHMVLPDVRGALVVDPYFGTLHPARRLAPGEYLVTTGDRDEIVRAPGRPDRFLDRVMDRPVRPHGLSPAARTVTRNFWQDGRRLLLFDFAGDTLWKGTSDCQAFPSTAKGAGGGVTYCDGHDLVMLRPVRED